MSNFEYVPVRKMREAAATGPCIRIFKTALMERTAYRDSPMVELRSRSLGNERIWRGRESGGRAFCARRCCTDKNLNEKLPGT
jgi:hypothetical protein